MPLNKPAPYAGDTKLANTNAHQNQSVLGKVQNSYCSPWDISIHGKHSIRAFPPLPVSHEYFRRAALSWPSVPANF